VTLFADITAVTTFSSHSTVSTVSEAKQACNNGRYMAEAFFIGSETRVWRRLSSYAARVARLVALPG